MTYRELLFERALEQYGYVTTDDARDLGVPPIELRKLAMRHTAFENIARGLYRFQRLPVAEHQEVIEAVLVVGGDAVAARETVLHLHALADVLPNAVHVATTQRVRKPLPPTIEIIREAVDDEDRVDFEGIPATSVRRALLDSRGFVPVDRLISAAQEAAKRGLVPRREAPDLIAAILGPTA
jgi:predicted transcriptional regulator of viral defense system